jgi:hypothetical protein
MICLPSIVLIDDTKEDLDEIQSSLVQAGYPCFPILYQNDEPDNISGIDHVKIEMINPRVIITDLNLQELQVDAVKLVGPIVEVLKKLASDGPYLLYFWSKNASTVKKVMELISERYSDLNFPLSWGVLDKTEFKSKKQDLTDKVAKLFVENPMFNALLSWENRVSVAAQNTVDSLFKLAKPAEINGIVQFQSETTTNLQKMLAVIGNETIGIKNAKEEPEVAIELGLEPVLYDHIQANYESIDRAIWLDVAEGIGSRLSAEKSVKAFLNSFYHVEELAEGSPKNKRGSWIELNHDYFGDTKNKAKIQQNLGRNIKTLINEEFLDSSQGTSATRADAHKATKLGFLELSAECDQAQRKTKLNKYFLSAMIPLEFEKFTKFRKGVSDTKHAGIYRVPNVMINGKEYIVKVSFLYHVGSIPDVSKWLGEPLFRLKNQILSDISFKASQHATRPGIIRFD